MKKNNQIYWKATMVLIMALCLQMVQGQCPPEATISYHGTIPSKKETGYTVKNSP